jgi:hypothetical protein
MQVGDWQLVERTGEDWRTVSVIFGLTVQVAAGQASSVAR